MFNFKNTTPNYFILGTPGTSVKYRSFPEEEYRSDYVPSYVKTILLVTNKETNEKRYCYVDTYGKSSAEEMTDKWFLMLNRNVNYHVEQIKR